MITKTKMVQQPTPIKPGTTKGRHNFLTNAQQHQSFTSTRVRGQGRVCGSNGGRGRNR